MDAPILRLLIQEKLVTGHLPHDRIPRMWGGPGSGETCDACGESVTKDQMVMENLDAVMGRPRTWRRRSHRRYRRTLTFL
jgi:hypothetical protein